MRGKLPRLQPCQRRPLLDDLVDCTRLQRPLRNVAPTINLPENTSALNFGSRKPDVQGIHGPARQIDDLIVFSS